jgi:hypothetical protein
MLRRHPCLTVAVADYRVLAQAPGRPADWTHEAPRARGWNPTGERVIQSLGFVRRLRARRSNFAFLAPYAIFPLDADDAADLILGGLDICTTLNCDLLVAELRDAGIHAAVAGGRDAETSFLVASDDRNTVSLPAVIREQMLAELVTPATIIAAIRHSLAATAADPDVQPAGHLVPYAGERDVWLQQRIAGGETR